MWQQNVFSGMFLLFPAITRLTTAMLIIISIFLNVVKLTLTLISVQLANEVRNLFSTTGSTETTFFLFLHCCHINVFMTPSFAFPHFTFQTNSENKLSHWRDAPPFFCRVALFLVTEYHNWIQKGCTLLKNMLHHFYTMYDGTSCIIIVWEDSKGDYFCVHLVFLTSNTLTTEPHHFIPQASFLSRLGKDSNRQKSASAN